MVADAIITSVLVRPWAADTKRSIPAARTYGSEPLTVADRSPFGAGTSPIVITWAPPIDPEPVGASVVSADEVADGNAVLGDSRIGAWTGEAIRTEAAIAACQSSVGASATAAGWVPGAADG